METKKLLHHEREQKYCHNKHNKQKCLLIIATVVVLALVTDLSRLDWHYAE